MKAVIFDAPEKVRITDKPEPSLLPDEVLLKINLVGLCGTDLNIYKGKMPLVSYPRIPGHEISAVIVDKGVEVPSSIVVGNTATINPYTSCGKCSACRASRFNTCKYNQTMGVQRDGAMLQYLAVPYRKVLQSNKLSAHQLALVEPLSVGYHAANRARVASNETVLVLGCGMVGIGAILASLRKKAIVIAADIDATKLETMKRLGAHYTIDNNNPDALKQIMDITNGEGVNATIEAVGSAYTFRQSIDACGFAARAVYVGYANADISLDTSQIVKKELDVLGSRNALNEFQDVIDMLEEGIFDTEMLISRVYPMQEIDEAFQYWKNKPGEVIKILTQIN